MATKYPNGRTKEFNDKRDIALDEEDKCLSDVDSTYDSSADSDYVDETELVSDDVYLRAHFMSPSTLTRSKFHVMRKTNERLNWSDVLSKLGLFLQAGGFIYSDILKSRFNFSAVFVHNNNGNCISRDLVTTPICLSNFLELAITVVGASIVCILAGLLESIICALLFGRERPPQVFKMFLSLIVIVVWHFAEMG